MFDDQASDRTFEWWTTTHRGLLAGALGAAGVAAAALHMRR
jgi:hypothetical protein